VNSRNNWYQVSLFVSLNYEEPERRAQFAPEIMKLRNAVDAAWLDARRPRDLALFMGEYSGIYHQRFYLPPTVGKHCPDMLADYSVTRIPAPRPARLKNIIAGSRDALRYWYPEFDPHVSLRFDRPPA
jgi:hypothetical protein